MNRKGHGIHSPFVFDLVSRVFRNKIDPDIVFSMKRVREKMLSDKRSVTTQCHNAGFEILKISQQKVQDIARYSPLPGKYGELLSKMAAEFGEPFIIEFGTCLGINTLYMASSSTRASVYTFESSHSLSEIAKENFESEGFNNIDIYTIPFEEVLPDIISRKNKPGMAFINGSHSKETVIRYFNSIAEISDNKTVIIINDINYSREMEEAWNEIKLNAKVSVTVDIFRMGIVFFREGINHRNYIVRY